MKTAVKTAITSFGMSGQVFHGPLLKVNPKFEVTHILERSKCLSAALFPNSKIVRNYQEIINCEDIELVVINTPDEFHFEMAAAALKAGKHVVVEKPVTLQSAEGTELIKLSKKNNKIFTVFQNRRWDGDFVTVSKILASGQLGRLIEFESHYDRYRTGIASDSWKEEAGEFAGVLYNLGSHMVDQAYVLFGKPTSVTAHLKIVRTGGVVTDYYDLRLDYKTFSAILKCSYLVHTQGPRYILNGENGSFFKYGIDPQEELLKAGNLPIGANWGKDSELFWGTLYQTENGNANQKRIETAAGNYNSFYKNVFEAIRNNAELAVKPEEAVEVLKILEACILSNREKRTVFL